MRLSFLAFAVLLSGISAKAGVVYTFTGAQEFDGTSFTIESPVFLNYSQTSPIVPVSGEFTVVGTDFGPITQVFFFDPVSITVNTDQATGSVFFGAYNVSMDGVNIDSQGDNLTVSGTPDVATPEPAMWPLLLIGSAMMILTKRSALTRTETSI